MQATQDATDRTGRLSSGYPARDLLTLNYSRSWRGQDGSWDRAARSTHDAHISAGGVDRDVSLAEVGEVDEQVDAAYRAKYGRYSSYVEPMIAHQARATTLKLTARGEPDREG